MAIKDIFVFKHVVATPLIVENGDKYDSIIEVFDGINLLYETRLVNVDPTHDVDGGEIAAGDYFGWRRRRRNGMWVIHMYTDSTRMSDMLPSKYPNPFQGGRKLIQAVQIHIGGRRHDGSRGCITIHPDAWGAFWRVVGEDEATNVRVHENNSPSWREVRR